MKLDRSQKPTASVELSFILPEEEHFKLDNALDVIFVKRSNLPTLRLNLIVNGGSKTDPINKKGLANLFAMMIDEGADDYNGLELMDEFDMLGSNFNVGCNNDGIYIGLRTLTENIDRSIELFAKVVTKPHFDEISFAREKRKVLTRLIQLRDDVEEIASSVFEYIVLGKEDLYSFPLVGYENDINNVTLNDLKNYYNSYFIPNNSALMVVGNIEKEELREKLNYYFRDWKPKVLDIEKYKSNLKEFPGIFFIHKEDSVQSEIRIGHISENRSRHDYFPRKLLNTILGGQFSSRINLNLREDKGYTYGASSRFNYFKECAFFNVSTSVAIENTANAIREIIKELNLIREGVTESELYFAKSSTILNYPSKFETNRQITYHLTTKYLYDLPNDYFNTYLDLIRDVTIDEVNKSAANHIHTDRLVILVVGDKEKLIPQLHEVNSDKITELDYVGKEIRVF
ncbi:MAG: pitrilysin family protein [Ignavibacteriaceae bacterium]|nr:pitrilysin family protein [Ignavibacteriaceae bacterium]